MGHRARRWLLSVGLLVCACGIDARGVRVTEEPTSSIDGGGGGPGPNDDGGGPGPNDADIGDGGSTIDAPFDGPVTPSRGRVTNGLIAIYELEENGGDVAKDTSGVSPALDLTVPPAVKWIPKALLFDVAAHVKSATGATKIVQRCKASNAVTIEAWIKYGTLPAFSRIVALSQNADTGNAAMTSDALTIGFDMRSSTNAYLRSTRNVYDGGTPTALVHLVETRDAAGVKRIYLNGAVVLDVLQDGDLSTWDETYPLSVGNTPALDRAFYGEVHLVAFYDRALSASEVATNRTAGADP